MLCAHYLLKPDSDLLKMPNNYVNCLLKFLISYLKKIVMNYSPDPTEKKDQPAYDKEKSSEKERSPVEKKQQQSDPNITELKGFVDPNEKLEVEGTDNEFDKDSV